jgi:hypothetical protein
MDHIITIGMVVYASLSVLGIIVVIGGALWLLSLFADAFKH